MSVSSCLLVFIICLFLHFCDCRRLGFVEKKSEDRKFNVSISKVENNHTRSDHQHAVDAVYPLPESMKDPKPAAEEGNNGDSISLDCKTEKIQDSEPNHGKERYNKERKRSSANPKGSSQASISWRLRSQEKSTEKDTALFDSDYSPPKTHPPSHN